MFLASRSQAGQPRFVGRACISRASGPEHRARTQNPLARIFVITFTQRIFIVNSFDDWPQRIAAYLHGRTQAFGMDIVRGALGLRYDQMDTPAWRRVAAAVMAAGWRKGRLEGVPCWVARLDKPGSGSI